MVFKTRYDYFEYQIMLFWLSNIPATFKRYINKILVEKLNIFIIIYYDNIFIYIENNKKSYIEQFDRS